MRSSLIPKLLTLALALVTLTATTSASASPMCADLFESRQDGILQNRAARAHMLLQLRPLLPPGRYEVIVNGSERQTIAVQYYDSKTQSTEVQMMLNSRALITTESSPLVIGLQGDRSSRDASIQLRSGNRIVISNTQVYGNTSKIDGLTTREVDMTFPLSPSKSSVITIKETVINTSDYRATSSYTVRTEIRRVPDQTAKPSPAGTNP